MKIQIAKVIFLEQLAIMKKLLDLMAFKLDKRTADYRYIKKEIMDYFYNGLTKLFKQLESENIIERCACKASLRKGYKNCDCGGSGFRNKK